MVRLVVTGFTFCQDPVAMERFAAATHSAPAKLAAEALTRGVDVIDSAFNAALALFA